MASFFSKTVRLSPCVAIACTSLIWSTSIIILDLGIWWCSCCCYYFCLYFFLFYHTQFWLSWLTIRYEAVLLLAFRYLMSQICRRIKWKQQWMSERMRYLCCSFNLYFIASVKFHRTTQFNFSLNMTGDVFFLLLFFLFSVLMLCTKFHQGVLKQKNWYERKKESPFVEEKKRKKSLKCAKKVNARKCTLVKTMD